MRLGSSLLQMSGVTAAAPDAAAPRTTSRSPPRDWLGPVLAAPITLWLLAAFAAPLATIVVLAFQPTGDVFAPLVLVPDLEQFRLIFGDAYYPRLIGDTLLLAAGVTIG